MKFQVAFEFMIIVGIVMAFLIPVWIYSSNVQQQTNTQLAVSYAKNTVQRIADASSLVYSQGEPAKVEIMVYMPKGVEEVNITNNTIMLSIWTGPTISNVFAESLADMTGTLPTTEGRYFVKIEAISDYVNISY